MEKHVDRQDMNVNSYMSGLRDSPKVSIEDEGAPAMPTSALASTYEPAGASTISPRPTATAKGIIGVMCELL